jgi:hypothetical protein
MADTIPPELAARIADELARWGQLLPATALELDKAKLGLNKFDLQVNVINKSFMTLFNSTMAYNRAMYDGQRGLKAMNSSVDAVADGIQGIAAAIAIFSKLNPALRIATAALGFFAGEVIKTSKIFAEQGDSVRKGFEGLAELGATAGGGMTEVFEGLQKLGLGVQEADHLIRQLAESSQDVVLFGGTMAKGRKQFENTVKGLEPFREQMLSLGLSQKQQNEAALALVKVQSRLNLTTEKNNQVSGEAVAKYVAELDQLTRITGLSRKQQQDIVDEAMREQMYAATRDRVAREKGPEAAKMMDRSLAMAAAAGPQVLKGFKDSISGFVSQSDEAGKLLLSTNAENLQVTEKLRKGEYKSVEELAKGFQGLYKTIGKNREAYGEDLAMMNNNDDAFIAYNEQVKAAKLSLNDLTKSTIAARTEQDEQTGDLGEQDKLLKEYNKLLMKQQKDMLKNQADVQTGVLNYTKTMNGGITAMNGLTDAARAAAEALGLIGKKETTKTRDGSDIDWEAALGTGHGIAGVPGGPGGVGSNESKQTQIATEKRKEAEANVEDLQKQREQLEKDKGRADEETKKARIAEHMARREAERKRAEEEHFRRKQGQAATWGGGGGGGTPPPLKDGHLETPEAIVEGMKAIAQPKSYNEEMSGYLKKIAQVESGGKKNAQPAIDKTTGKRASTAAGLFQFTNETWNENVKAMGKNYGLNDRFDPKKAAEVAAFFSEQNKKKLTEGINLGSGRRIEGMGPDYKATEADAYMAHFLGAAGALKFLKALKSNPDMEAEDAVGKAAANSNPNIFYSGFKNNRDTPTDTLPKRTLAEVYGMMSKKLDRGAQEIAQGRTTEDVLQLADGGIIPAKPGGTMIKAGEAGMDEAFIPMKNGKIGVNIDKKSMTTALTEAAGNPILGSLLFKSVPQLTSLATMMESVDTMKSDKTVSAKFLEIASMLNPTVRVIAAVAEAFKANLDLPAAKETLDAKATAPVLDTTALGKEIKAALQDMNAPDNSQANNEQLVELLNDLIKEQRTANDISGRILQVSSN